MKKDRVIAISLSLFYLILFIPFLGHVHLFDWDEINFAEAAREMLVTGDWLNVQINYEPFWEKPPLFIWLQALSMKVFGVNAFGARFPNVIIGLVSVLSLYFISLKEYSRQTAIAAFLLFLGAFTPHLYFKTGIIDPLFNLFMFYAVYMLYSSSKQEVKWKYFLYSGLFLGLAVLTKGPAAILIVGLTGLVYQIVYKKNFYTLKELVFLVFGLLLLPGIWFGIQIANSGWWFVSEFINYQIELMRQPVASHGQPFYYHPVVLLLGCFPLFILSFSPLFTKNAHSDMTLMRWMKVLFWVVLILFSLVTTKIVHYSSMCYLPLAMLTAQWVVSGNNLKMYQKIVLTIVGFIWSMLWLALAYIGNSLSFKRDVIDMIDDVFVKAQLSSDVIWHPAHYLLAVFSFVLLLFLVVRYSKVNLMSFLLFNTMFISFALMQIVPRIESYIQKDWVDHLSTYQKKEMFHFTSGFKSYAHYFYTHQSNKPYLAEVKMDFLKEKGYASFYDLNTQEKRNFEIAFREYIIHQTEVPFSLSVKVDHKNTYDTDPDLLKVFEGNGYQVWERNH